MPDTRECRSHAELVVKDASFTGNSNALEYFSYLVKYV
jgi:hypothetical protein